jgi:hypothetical protein
MLPMQENESLQIEQVQKICIRGFTSLTHAWPQPTTEQSSGEEYRYFFFG